jgi:hypothetical protein
LTRLATGPMVDVAVVDKVYIFCKRVRESA